MIWVVFTTECSGKTTFCKQQFSKLLDYDLIDYDKISNVPNIETENEYLITKLLIKIGNEDKKIYFTNIFPPQFILDAKDYFDNIKFCVISLSDDDLLSNINKRHHQLYNSNYIIEHNKKLKKILEKNKILNFNTFEDFKKYFLPKETKRGITQRIIRL